MDFNKIQKYVNKLKSKREINLKHLSYGHTHIEDAMPSITDLFNNFGQNIEKAGGPSVIYTHNNKKVIGKTQFIVDLNNMPESFKSKLQEIYDQIGDIPREKSDTQIEDLFNKQVHTEYINWSKKTNIHLRGTNNSKYLQLTIETYKKLGFIIHFIPAKGYKFNYDLIKFEKK